MSVPCGSWKSVEPLPSILTTYTPPAVCSTRYTAGRVDATALTTAQPDYAIQDNWDPVWYSCLPNEYNLVQCPYLTFSPGLCPGGWATAEEHTFGSVTFATCCMRYVVSLSRLRFFVFFDLANSLQRLSCTVIDGKLYRMRKDNKQLPSRSRRHYHSIHYRQRRDYHDGNRNPRSSRLGRHVGVLRPGQVCCSDGLHGIEQRDKQRDDQPASGYIYSE